MEWACVKREARQVAKKLLIPVLSSTVVFGAMQYRLQQMEYRLNYAEKTGSLRQQLLEQLQTLMELKSRYRQLRPAPVGQANEWYELQIKIALVKDNIRAAEYALSKAEGRAPRNFDLELIPPPPPSNFQVKIQ